VRNGSKRRTPPATRTRSGPSHPGIGELDSFVPFPGRVLLIPIVGDGPAPPGGGVGGGPIDPPGEPCPSGTDYDLPCQRMSVDAEENRVTSKVWSGP
jgi:hypothetical protein